MKLNLIGMSLAGIISCMSTSHLSTGVIHSFTITALTQQTHGTHGTKTLCAWRNYIVTAQ